MINISVIIPCYNAEKYLVETIESVLKQTIKPYEIIFINDCSTDESVNIIREYKESIEDETKIRLINLNRNMGIGYVRQKGLEYSNCPYISYLSSDDCWDKDFLKKSIPYLGLNKGTYTDYYLCDSNLIPERIFRAEDFSVDKIIDYALNRNMFVNFSSIILSKYIGFRFLTNLRFGEDLIFLLDSVIHNFEWKRISKPLLYYRRHKEQGTHRKKLYDDILIGFYTKERLVELGLNEKFVINKMNDLLIRRYSKLKNIKNLGRKILKFIRGFN